MPTRRWVCTEGHEFELDDTEDAASGIAIRATRKRYEGGCDTHDDRKQKCGAKVTEKVFDPAKGSFVAASVAASP